MKVELGKMDRKIVIQQAVQTQGADGSILDTYGTIKTLYAQLIPAGASEPYEGGEKRQVQTNRFLVHFTNTNINSANHRLLYNGRIYEITGVEEPEIEGTFNRNRFLLIHAVAKGSGADASSGAYSSGYQQNAYS